MVKISTTLLSKRLYHISKKQAIHASQLKEVFSDTQVVSHRLGSLPFDWLKEIKPEDRALVTESVSDCFSTFARETKDFDERIFPRRSQSFILKTNNIFSEKYQELKKQLSALLKRDDISIDYAGSGCFKTCFKINVGEYSYALSTFKDKGSSFKSVDIPWHGRAEEPVLIFWNYKRSPHGCFAKPFMSKVCVDDKYDGFILSKYVSLSASNKKTKGAFVSSREFLLDVDSHNRYNNLVFEAGGRYPNSRYIADPKTRFVWQQFAQILDANMSDLEQKKFLNPLVIQDFLLKKAKNGVDICSDKFRKNIKNELYHHYLDNEIKTNPFYTDQERLFLRALSITKVDSPLHKILLKSVGRVMNSRTAKSSGYENFGELVEEMLKSVDRKTSKQIRAVKKVRKLKDELLSLGQFGKYNAYLINDVQNLFIFHNEDLQRVSAKYYPKLLDYELVLNKADEVSKWNDS